MPVIIPPSRDRLGESILQAEAADATTDTMRIVRLPRGVVGLEVSQEVYDVWAASHADEAEPPHPPPSGDDDPAVPEAPDPEPGDADAETATPDPDGDATDSGTPARKRTSRRN